jgi:hypothetical protein
MDFRLSCTATSHLFSLTNNTYDSQRSLPSVCFVLSESGRIIFSFTPRGSKSLIALSFFVSYITPKERAPHQRVITSNTEARITRHDTHSSTKPKIPSTSIELKRWLSKHRQLRLQHPLAAAHRHSEILRVRSRQLQPWCCEASLLKRDTLRGRRM